MFRKFLDEFWDTANPFTRHSEDMTAEEAKKQSSFESFDYYKPYPSMYMTHLRAHYAGRTTAASGGGRTGSTTATTTTNDNAGVPPMNDVVTVNIGGPLAPNTDGARLTVMNTVKKYDADERNEALRWILHVIIAIAVGVLATTISYTVEFVDNYRAAQLYDLIKKHHMSGRFIGYLFSIGVSMALVVVAAAVVVFFEPAAAGGGIPDVIAYLNGVHVPKAMKLRTFLAKSISCMCAVAGGLPVGLEAPLIHLGAIVGAGVTQGRSHALGCQTKLFQAFRNNKDRRDFITAGAACGVSAAFGAPIGGLLFVMEEVSSFWDHSASGQIFLATMICFTTIGIIRSMLEDQQLLGWVSNAVSVLFEVNLTIPLNLFSIVPSFFLGILCGAFAAVFTKVNLMLVKYRRRYLRPFVFRRFVEPLIIVLLYGTLSYMLALVPDCRPTHAMSSANGSFVWGTENRTQLFTATCATEDAYAPLATLTMGTGKDTIRHLLSRQTIGEFPAVYILIFLTLYTFFASWSSGTAVSGGLVVPSLVIGAAFGRLYGQILWFLAVRGAGAERSYKVSQAWLDPGVFALIGAGAFFSGTSRMTMSICVIMVELSSELHYLLPVMVAIIMSKTVADFISEPLYHHMLRLDSVPYLQAHLLRPGFEQLTAADVMTSKVVTLRLREKTSVVLNALRHTTHHAFPVVEAVQEERSERGNCPVNGKPLGREELGEEEEEKRVRYKFVGLVTREDVHIFLALPALYSAHQSSGSSDLRGRGSGLELAPSVLAINKMTWAEWLTHKTSLFFVLGSKRWLEIWARGNNTAGVLEKVDVDASESNDPNGSEDRPNPLSVDERRLPPVLDFSLIVNRSPWVIPPFFNLQMAYHTFRMMGLRHMVVVDGDAVVGIITRKDLLVDTLLRRLRELHGENNNGGSAGNTPPASLSVPDEHDGISFSSRSRTEGFMQTVASSSLPSSQVDIPNLLFLGSANTDAGPHK
ncbi:chloride channel protein [Trypanosoma rangeli SC58]|uniref:Chloride channel protein n=1 Tax=Trypanosoma rangeli SC58 TaxID=429131 RepID=A0A061J9D4_TRYRA|nr:chloride channel protein [Trypanosoma rangeli SC58]